MLVFTDGRRVWCGFLCVPRVSDGVEWVLPLWILYLVYVGLSGGCRATSSLRTWWELGLGLTGVWACWVWGFYTDTDSGAVGCWLTWTGPRGLTYMYGYGHLQ